MFRMSRTHRQRQPDHLDLVTAAAVLGLLQHGDADATLRVPRDLEDVTIQLQTQAQLSSADGWLRQMVTERLVCHCDADEWPAT